MNRKFEELLLLFCSCTINGMKPGSIFTCYKEDIEEVEKVIEYYQYALYCQNIKLDILKDREKSILIYVYREELLTQFWNGEKAIRFLLHQGYSKEINKNIYRLKMRLKEHDFPHEIGAFLGYSIEDIISFIENDGKNYKCIGPWKVYHKESQKQQIFQKFKECTDTYLTRFYAGQNLNQLINA